MVSQLLSRRLLEYTSTAYHVQDLLTEFTAGFHIRRQAGPVSELSASELKRVPYE